VTTHSNNLNGDEVNTQPSSSPNGSSFKNQVESQATNTDSGEAIDRGRTLDSISRPLEVLHGWDSVKSLPANHSHFQWGATVTRAPSHQVQPK